MRNIQLSRDRPAQVISGIIPSVRAVALEQLATQFNGFATVVLLPHLRGADALSEELESATTVLARRDTPLTVATLPHPPDPEEDRSGQSPSDRILDRAAIFSLLRERAREDTPEPLIILTEFAAVLGSAPHPETLDAQSITLSCGDNFGFDQLRKLLDGDLNYDGEAICEYPGQYAVRGGLIDVYPPNLQAPLRIDFFGDEIDSLRTFDPTSQRSEDLVASATLAPNSPLESESGDEQATMLDYLGGPINWVWLEGDRQAREMPECYQEFENIADKRPHLGKILDRSKGQNDRFSALDALAQTPQFFHETTPLTEWEAGGFAHLWRDLSLGLGLDRSAKELAVREGIYTELRRRQEAGEALILIAHNEAEASRLEALIKEEAGTPALDIEFRIGLIEHGFRLCQPSGTPVDWFPSGSDVINVLSENDLLGRSALARGRGPKRKLPQRSQVDHLLDFAELAEGDPLVHLAHGVCLFQGISKMKLGGSEDEVISLEFAGNITLHVPLHDSHLLTRYVGLAKSGPKLGRLGTGSWEKTRGEAEKATLDFAAEMLRMQAVRQAVEGIPFGPDQQWQEQFEGAFSYDLTPDQAVAVEETKLDMEAARPMDRLICGDVGFGKTEVAIRAAFKAVMDGKQVVILVPTTVLAQQHYNTFRNRMAEFPVVVEMLNRFRSAKESKVILEQMANGGIDIVIGTHRLLSKDVQFSDLGLIVVDEEHRFGVRHKERLKHLRAHVDVLTMSATPIPRTLYLALMGARDLSTIETPPSNRRPIETIVRGYDEDLIRKAIQFEIDRGGQVFYLHNRVQSIEAVAERLREWIPEASIGVGHGQMDEARLEQVMTDFVAAKHDILVCTTIIENGLDIPNSNTLIIEGADRFGLAQLYQLRGRVGRFNRQAYAYLLLHNQTSVREIAQERLTAMRQHNQLGAGFQIAMRDLELRGAGNLLGPQQSGHIAGVGFELYCQLLRQSVARLKGEESASHIRAVVKIDFVSAGDGPAKTGQDRSTDSGFAALKAAELNQTHVKTISASIPQNYISDTQLRIDIYRRLALAESTDQVDKIADELGDRFGKPARPVEILLLVTRIRTLAQECGYGHLESEGNRLKIRRASGKRDDYVKNGSRFPRLTAKNPLRRLREIEQFLFRNRPKRQ